MKFRIFLAVVAPLLFISLGCNQQPAAASSTPPPADSVPVAAEAPAPEPAPLPDSVQLRELATALLQLAAKKDFAAIADHIHPTKGLRFSPYPSVDTKADKHFTADQFRTQATTDAAKKVLWGTSDPLDEPIKLTLEGYFKEFAYDKDYLGKGKSAYDEAIGSSTIIDNCAEVYPGLHFVEYYWGGSNPEEEPFVWGSIRLVMEMQDGKPYVVAWIHNAWAT